MVWGCFYSIFAPGRCVLSYPNDALSDDIDALISGANALSAAADSVGTISSGSDVLVSNFDHVEEVFDNLQAFLSELKSGHFYTPVGALMPFAGTSAYVPSGWIMCYGQSYATATASTDLQTILNAAGFSAIPDLRGRVIAGIDNMGGTDAALLSLDNTPGATGGAETLPAHTHTFTTSTTGQVAYPYAINQYAAGSGSAFTINVQSQAGGYVGGTFATAGDHAHTGTTNSTGTGSHGVVQPTIVFNYIIKN